MRADPPLHREPPMGVCECGESVWSLGESGQYDVCDDCAEGDR